jgi:hypothetical protein
MSARDLKAALGRGRWKAYFKFLVEPNPWDPPTPAEHEIDLFGYRFEEPDPLLLDGRIKTDRAASPAAAAAGAIATAPR